MAVCSLISAWYRQKLMLGCCCLRVARRVLEGSSKGWKYIGPWFWVHGACHEMVNGFIGCFAAGAHIVWA
eukprot:10010490-Ditylum_brightwellii.AAC.1